METVFEYSESLHRCLVASFAPGHAHSAAPVVFSSGNNYFSVGLFATSDAPGGGANGLFNGGGFASLQAQAVGTLAVAAFTLSLALITWFLINVTLGLRVSLEDEVRGLDIAEMGMEAYAGDPMGK